MDQVTVPRATVQQALEALCLDAGERQDSLEADAITALRAALEQSARPLCKGIPRRGCNYLAPSDTLCNKCGEIHHHHQMVAQFEAAQQPEQENPTRQMPEWMDYDQATDVLTIHGRRYSAAMFGERGFLSPAGTLLQVAEGQPDCVTLMTILPAEPK